MKKINMLSSVKEEFPEIFTKVKGTLRKNGVKRFNFDHCGHSSDSAKGSLFMSALLGIKQCKKCGGDVKESIAYSVWKRMLDNQIEEEDFILNMVQEHGVILKDDLKAMIESRYGKDDSEALGFLCYFGYLNVDRDKRDNLGIIEYSINSDKNLSKRYERIQ